jgi:hypothetical protein
MPRDMVSRIASIYLTDIDAGNKIGSCPFRLRDTGATLI